MNLETLEAMCDRLERRMDIIEKQLQAKRRLVLAHYPISVSLRDTAPLSWWGCKVKRSPKNSFLILWFSVLSVCISL